MPPFESRIPRWPRGARHCFGAATLSGSLLLAASLAAAQAATPSPYAGQESREIKALAPEEISDLLAGRGMGFAKSAELNGYPGPAHVLELADELGLTPEQRAQTQEIFERMLTAARSLGAQLVEAERDLEESFRTRQASAESLARALEQISVLQGKLRGAHLQAHIEQARILTAGQVSLYARLRGYADGAAGHGAHRHGH